MLMTFGNHCGTLITTVLNKDIFTSQFSCSSTQYFSDESVKAYWPILQSELKTDSCPFTNGAGSLAKPYEYSEGTGP